MGCNRLILLLLVPFFSQCGNSSSDAQDPLSRTLPVGGALIQESVFTLCSSTFKKSDLLKLLNGNLVVVSENKEKSAGAAEAVSGLVTSLLINGLNFSDPYDYSFSAGDYTFTSGEASYTFSFYFAQAYGSYAAGDKIPYDLFDVDSYVSGVGISGSFPNYSYTYSQGPLYALIAGSVDISGVSLADLDISLKVDGSKISFALNTANNYNGRDPRSQDVLHISITTTAATLAAISAQFEAGGYGLDYKGTSYSSQYYSIEQNFGESIFYVKKDSTGYYSEGDYLSAMTKSGITLYQKGLLSQRQQNYTDYYCDATRTEKVATALHDLDLTGGTFTFSDGTTVRYGLEAF